MEARDLGLEVGQHCHSLIIKAATKSQPGSSREKQTLLKHLLMQDFGKTWGTRNIALITFGEYILSQFILTTKFRSLPNTEYTHRLLKTSQSLLIVALGSTQGWECHPLDQDQYKWGIKMVFLRKHKKDTAKIKTKCYRNLLMLGGFVWAFYMKTQWGGRIELGVDWSWGSSTEVRGRKGNKEDAQQIQACCSEGEDASNRVWPSGS